MGVVVSVGAGATIPLSAPPALPAVPIVALVNHSATDEALFLGQFCGGVPTTSRTVVTATHCLAERTADTVDVVAGVVDLCADGARPAERRRVVSITALPHSGGTLSELTLARAFTTTLASLADTADLPVPGSRVVGWGWGRDAVSGTPACVLRRVDLLVVAVDECRAISTATYLSDDGHPPGVSLCTVPLDGVNTCNGDSGGPVTMAHAEGSDEVLLVAITMSGEGCGPNGLGLAVVPR